MKWGRLNPSVPYNSPASYLGASVPPELRDVRIPPMLMHVASDRPHLLLAGGRVADLRAGVLRRADVAIAADRISAVVEGARQTRKDRKSVV